MTENRVRIVTVYAEYLDFFAVEIYNAVFYLYLFKSYFEKYDLVAADSIKLVEVRFFA